MRKTYNNNDCLFALSFDKKGNCVKANFVAGYYDGDAINKKARHLALVKTIPYFSCDGKTQKLFEDYGVHVFANVLVDVWESETAAMFVVTDEEDCF